MSPRVQPADRTLALPPVQRPAPAVTQPERDSLRSWVERHYRPWRFRVGGSRLAGFQVIDDVTDKTVSECGDADEASRVAALLNSAYRVDNLWWILSW